MLVARESPALAHTAEWARAAGARVTVLPVDLRDDAATRAVAARLAADLAAGSTLVHGAGVGPHRRELTADGLEIAFVATTCRRCACRDRHSPRAASTVSWT